MIRLHTNRHQPEDSELLKQYLATGDLQYLGVLYNRYIHLVYGVCLKYLKNRDESKDAVNQIFEKLIVEIPKFEIQNFRSWLYVMVKNHCLMALRRDKTEKKQKDQFFQNFYMESTTVLHPIDEERNDALEERLLRCLERLKEQQQSCVRMFYYDNRCYADIAKHLGIDHKKVKSYIQNGKRNLKICLEQNTGNDEF